ncbi:hypothetical protein MUK42_01166, partial [Musa troglodytarum]
NTVGGGSLLRQAEHCRGRRDRGRCGWGGCDRWILAQVGLLLPLLTLAVILIFFLTIAEGDSDREREMSSPWVGSQPNPTYHGSITECLMGDEFELGTGATCRIVAHSAITPFPSLVMETG